ncbi:MAG: hypothetical protein M3Q81_00475 [bacterium]|nr:hypothetical protein [bacterium]
MTTEQSSATLFDFLPEAVNSLEPENRQKILPKLGALKSMLTGSLESFKRKTADLEISRGLPDNAQEIIRKVIKAIEGGQDVEGAREDLEKVEKDLLKFVDPYTHNNRTPVGDAQARIADREAQSTRRY